MDAPTYHALARHEHEVKARVYAKYGLFRKAASHTSRARYHASFGSEQADAAGESAKTDAATERLRLESKMLSIRRARGGHEKEGELDADGWPKFGARMKALDASRAKYRAR
jgi:hypothetical protein